MKTRWLWLLCVMATVAGCSESQPPAGGSPPPNATAGGGGPPAPVPPPPAPPPAATAAPAIAPPPAAAAPIPGAVQEKASDEFTKKGIAGKSMGKGILATPASVYLRIPDRAIFLSVDHAKNLYKGEHGALPKTHEEFMRDIIEANNIKLPELPDDSRYLYVPAEEELMIERTPM